MLLNLLSAEEAKKIIKKEEIAIQIAPASRIGIAELLNMNINKDPSAPIQNALMEIGVSGVYETPLGADVVAMIESKEILNAIKSQTLPIFTSCCVEWRLVSKRFVKKGHLSKMISPQMMIGFLIKKFFNKNAKVLAIMPCIMKQEETWYVFDNKKYVDYVMTSIEAAKMIKDIVDEKADESPATCFCSKAGMGFGASGGVAGALIAYMKKIEDVGLLKKEKETGWVRMDLRIKDEIWHAYKIWGLIHMNKFMQEVVMKDEKCLFVEVMACPYGCVGGAGQPRIPLEKIKIRAKEMEEIAKKKPETLYDFDKGKDIIKKINELNEKEKKWMYFSSPLLTP